MSKEVLDPNYVIPFSNLGIKDIDTVGGKNASLGEMISNLHASGIRVPNGFATTAKAFNEFLIYNDLVGKIDQKLKNLDVENIPKLTATGAEIRDWINKASFQVEFEKEIRDAFDVLDEKQGSSFAVRSSATAEDLPQASFAGQQETFLNVSGIENILDSIRLVFASLYNDRAISYRVHQNFSHSDVAISAGIQKMVRSDKAASGVMFTLDTESGFREVVFITSSYGLGETVVQGSVNPDEFYLFKNSLSNGKYPILKKALGSKLIQMRFAGSGKNSGVETTEVPTEMRNMFSITDQEAIELAQYALIIERHYGRPMDIEWGKDGVDGKIYILQARPETVKSSGSVKKRQRYKIKVDANDRKILSTGRAIGQKVGSGPVKMLHDISEIDKLEKGDVLVTDMTDPNWESVMKRASAIVTNRGGRTCHAAIIARELGVPAVVGCGDATKVLQNGTDVTVSCAEGDEGYVYQGALDTEVTNIEVGALKKLPLKIMMNLGNPQLAFEYSQIPNDGIGLARLEFIINNNVGIHPQAILDYPNVSGNIKTEIEKKVIGYESPNKFYTGKLIEGISTIAAAFHPKPVIVRLSDFKSNEYKKLIGGVEYEPDEENPMLGFRGVSRYLSRQFHDAFSMECEALRFVRNEMGLENVEVMVPFVRTLSQAEKVISLLDSQGLKRGENGLRIIMMCEVPSNAILAYEFLEYFDGFSIGSNDLTQLSLGLDRDSGDEILAADFKESDLTVKKLITQAIEACFSENKYVGICGQGPSDDPDFAHWLMDKGISSLSLNPDTIIDTWKRLEQ